MQKLYTLFLLITVSFISAFGASTTSTVNVNGVTREYMTVTPNVKRELFTSVIVFLHGVGGKITGCDDIICYEEVAQQMADLTGSIVLLPQALDEQNPQIKQLSSLLPQLSFLGVDALEIPVNSIWNAGVSVPLDNELKSILQSVGFGDIAAAGKIVLNKDVDDVAFINHIIDASRTSALIPVLSNVFIVGVSMGGAMTYKYAYSGNSQADAIAVISGFVGAEVDNNKPLGIPACIFHSKDDEVVLFNGGIFNEPIPEIVGGIASKSACWTVLPDVYDFPNIADDGITVQKITYPCEPELWFYTLTGAKHADFMKSDYQTGPNDMGYISQIRHFFFLGWVYNSVENHCANSSIAFFNPNPAKENISFTVSGNYELKTVTGKTVLKGNILAGEMISIGNISTGLYIVTLKSIEGNFVDKLIVK